MLFDRRIGDRRQRKRTTEQTDRRNDPPSHERRQWTCGLLYRTARPIAEIELWLEHNTRGKWAVGLEGVDEGLKSKVLKLMFERIEDKEEFIEYFSGR